MPQSNKIYDKIKRETRTFTKLEQNASHDAGINLRVGTENYEWYLRKIFDQISNITSIYEIQ